MLCHALHVVYRTQLGIDKYIQAPEKIVEQLASLLIEHLSVLLAPLRNISRARRRCILLPLMVVMVAMVV